MNRYLCKKGMYMEEKSFTLNYREYDTIEELPATYKHLYKAAIDATENSYAPYSQFNVGAAVLMENGAVITGSNQENAAYPSGLCAERTALFYASASRPDKAMTGIAIAAGQNGQICKSPATPCGACRQVMAQYQTKSGKSMSVLLVGAEKIWRFEKVDDLLPLIFDSI